MMLESSSMVNMFIVVEHIGASLMANTAIVAVWVSLHARPGSWIRNETVRLPLMGWLSELQYFKLLITSSHCRILRVVFKSMRVCSMDPLFPLLQVDESPVNPVGNSLATSSLLSSV